MVFYQLFNIGAAVVAVVAAYTTLVGAYEPPPRFVAFVALLALSGVCTMKADLVQYQKKDQPRTWGNRPFPEDKQ